jgi:hypothetical protein
MPALFVTGMEWSEMTLFMIPPHSQKNFLKINILIFYIKLITFYHFLNKKITIK